MIPILLGIAFLCFFFSFVLRWRNFQKAKICQKELYDSLFNYLKGLSDICPEPALFESWSLVSFFDYCLNHPDKHPPQAWLEERWESLVGYFSDHANLNRCFVRKNKTEKLKMLRTFSFFPFSFFQCFCLNWIIRNHDDGFLLEALKQWRLINFDFSWNLAWLALVFLDKTDDKILAEIASASMHEHIDSQFRLHCKEINVGLWEHDIRKTLLGFLSHHEEVKQDLGIYGLGFFCFSGVSVQVVKKLDGAGKERFLLIMRSLGKMNHHAIPELVYEWAYQLTYPTWETMQEVYDFLNNNGEEGKMQIAKLRQGEHTFWQNFFRDRSSDA
jgi:hypothetical protein